MLNVYPQRDTYPENIHEEEEQDIISLNQAAIREVLSSYRFKDVWAAWGNEITRRPFLMNCLRGLVECFGDQYSWLHYGSLTATGNPRHPSRMPYNESFRRFDIYKYLENY